MKKPLQNIIAQWKQKFASLSDENAWKGKVTSKIILKLIAQNKDKKKKLLNPKYIYFLLKLFILLQKIHIFAMPFLL